MNANEAARLAEESAIPSKKLLDYVFHEVRAKANKSIRHAVLDLNSLDLSMEQKRALSGYLENLGYKLEKHSSYQGTFYTLRW